MNLTKIELYQLECHVLLCLRIPITRIQIPLTDTASQLQIQENTLLTADKMEIYYT